ncbi:MAG: Type secretion system protein N-terminal domain, partial [Actinomycetota bacterium]
MVGPTATTSTQPALLDCDAVDPMPDAIERVPAVLARRLAVLPLGILDAALHVAVTHPVDDDARTALLAASAADVLVEHPAADP